MKPTLEVLTSLISVLMFVAGVITWYSGAVRKSYAAQRDYEHLKNSYMQLSGAQAATAKEMDSRFDSMMLELKEIKALQLAVMVKISPHDSTSGFFRNQSGQGS